MACLWGREQREGGGTRERGGGREGRGREEGNVLQNALFPNDHLELHVHYSKQTVRYHV